MISSPTSPAMLDLRLDFTILLVLDVFLSRMSHSESEQGHTEVCTSPTPVCCGRRRPRCEDSLVSTHTPAGCDHCTSHQIWPKSLYSTVTMSVAASTRVMCAQRTNNTVSMTRCELRHQKEYYQVKGERRAGWRSGFLVRRKVDRWASCRAETQCERGVGAKHRGTLCSSRVANRYMHARCSRQSVALSREGWESLYSLHTDDHALLED